MRTDSVQARKEPVQARSRARFERILEVAVDLVIARGVDAVPMSDIAQGAGVSIASLYQYFPDKASIVATLAGRYNDAGQTCVKAVFDRVRAPPDLLPAAIEMLESYYDFFRTVPGAYAVWQATQSDARLQALDEEDCERHAATVAAAVMRARPDFGPEDAGRFGKLLSLSVATIVRSAVTQPPEEGARLIALGGEAFVAPAVAHAMAMDRG